MNGGMTMDIKQGIQDVLYLIITGILPLLITYGILFLKVKIKEQEKKENLLHCISFSKMVNIRLIVMSLKAGLMNRILQVLIL